MSANNPDDASAPASVDAPRWRGRFPRNDIITLLQVNRSFNLAESTSLDLRFGELLELVGLDAVRELRLGYGAPEGAPVLRSAVASLCEVPPAQVIATNGAALGLYLLAVELCRPGDEVVLFTPSFPPSRDALIGSGVRVVPAPLDFDGGYRVELDAFAAALTPSTRLVSLASPQNPSGVSTQLSTLRAMLELMSARAPEAMLFVDETYRFATYGDAPVPPSAASLDPRVITGASVSKAFGAPGLRVGWLTVADAGLRARLLTAKMNIVISGSPLDETLAGLLLGRREAVLAPRRALLAEGLAQVSAWQAAHAAHVEWVRPDGGALCCVRLRRDAFDDAAVARLWAALPGRELQLASGEWFGEQLRVFRLGFGYLELERLALALAALGELVTDSPLAKTRP